MAKSILSTDEMRALKKSGASTGRIAELAQVTTQAVRTRFSPNYQRRVSKGHYRSLRGNSRKNYVDKQSQRQRNAQAQSRHLAKNARQPGGVRWTQEEVQYLKYHSGTKTALEIALALQRTFYSVTKAAFRYRVSLRK